jgi:hypothetical protein
MQRITTVDGYVFPLDIIQGLPYIKMPMLTDDEFATLPHVTLTSDMPWHHNVFDCTLSNENDWYQNTTNWSEGLTQSPFKLDGTYKHLRDHLEANVHDLLDLTNRFLPDDDPSVLVHASKINREARPS